MKLSRVEIITGISKIEPLKKALGKFHITGMTVYQVLGCGVQHGTQEFEVEEKNKEISLLPKEVVMIVLPTEELDGLLEFVKKELYTGHIGDGKIFVSDVTNVVRVRTGEEGVDALLYGKNKGNTVNKCLKRVERNAREKVGAAQYCGNRCGTDHRHKLSAFYRAGSIDHWSAVYHYNGNCLCF